MGQPARKARTHKQLPIEAEIENIIRVIEDDERLYAAWLRLINAGDQEGAQALLAGYLRVVAGQGG